MEPFMPHANGVAGIIGASRNGTDHTGIHGIASWVEMMSIHVDAVAGIRYFTQ